MSTDPLGLTHLQRAASDWCAWYSGDPAMRDAGGDYAHVDQLRRNAESRAWHRAAFKRITMSVFPGWGRGRTLPPFCSLSPRADSSDFPAVPSLSVIGDFEYPYDAATIRRMRDIYMARIVGPAATLKITDVGPGS